MWLVTSNLRAGNDTVLCHAWLRGATMGDKIMLHCRFVSFFLMSFCRYFSLGRRMGLYGLCCELNIRPMYYQDSAGYLSGGGLDG